jgi:PAS domain-containing protein
VLVRKAYVRCCREAKCGTRCPIEELIFLPRSCHCSSMARECSDKVKMRIRKAARPEGVAVSVTGRLVRDESGLSHGDLIILRDITKRKRVEAKFAAALRTALDAMVAVNQEDKVLLVIAQTEGVFGPRREELLGREADLLSPPRFERHHRALEVGQASGDTCFSLKLPREKDHLCPAEFQRQECKA